MKKVLVLGCSGSIGSNTIDIIRNMKDQFCVCGVQAHTNEIKLNQIAEEFSCPSLLSCNATYDDFQRLIDKSKPDIIVNGIAGAAGLMPSKISIENKIDLALANKETIVMAGKLIKSLAKEKNVNILPVDSEHSAIFSLTEKIGANNISKVLITASGGPFRNYSQEQLKHVTLEQALNHPTWKMGKKITIDSATLANKGLEVIEASYLFDLSYDEIEVLVHPQSIVHSLVRTKDGVLYAQISDPDMKHPILNALTWPTIKNNYLEEFDLFSKSLEFYKTRMNDFPLLKYAFDCIKYGDAYPIAFNAANEVAVNLFINKKIDYTQISEIVISVLNKNWYNKILSFDDVFENDKLARKYAKDFI
jgi:1-deoxy-D-xylulose-5-phosphate reductoisomerase